MAVGLSIVVVVVVVAVTVVVTFDVGNVSLVVDSAETDPL